MFEEYFLKFYILFPFIFALIISLLTFIRNPIYLRKIGNFIFSWNLLNSTILYFASDNTKINLFNFDFNLNNFSSLLLLSVSIILFVLSLNFKYFILKKQRLFFATILLNLGLVNLMLLTQSATLILISLFWFILSTFLLQKSFSIKKVTKNKLILALGFDFFVFCLALFLISNHFLKYFLLNEIPFDFTSISSALDNVDESSGKFAFFGFMLLAFRFLNCIPFGYSNFIYSSALNPMILVVGLFYNLLCAIILNLKIHTAFIDQLSEYRGEILLILFINFIYYTLLTLRQDNVLKFLSNNLLTNSLILFLTLYIIGTESFDILEYSFIVLLFAFVFLALILISLVQKFKSAKLEDFLNIKDSSKPVFAMTALSFLTFAKIPLLALFKPMLMCLLLIFSINFDSNLINNCIYIVIFGIFLNSIANLNILQKILFEPIAKPKGVFSFGLNQTSSLVILIIILLFLTFGVDNIFNILESSSLMEF